jgi:hypothetical protein
MERKNAERGIVTRSKSPRVKKKLDVSTSKPKRAARSKKGGARNIHVSPSSSGSDEIDEDYAEFLKTYDPQEFYPSIPSHDEEESQITVESKRKETLKSSKVASNSS